MYNLYEIHMNKKIIDKNKKRYIKVKKYVL